MCLTISFWHHGPFPRAKTAKKPIHVYKNLVGYCNGDYMTPCMHENIHFRKGVFVLESNLDKPSYYNQIGKGIHAYRTNKIAGRSYGQVFNAIIPVGAKYYIGTKEEIVADHLIIFYSSAEYNDYINQYKKK